MSEEIAIRIAESIEQIHSDFAVYNSISFGIWVILLFMLCCKNMGGK
jgi:hypothetical protein